MPKVADVERLMSAEELADVLSLRPNAVKRMAREGAIPGYKGAKEASPWRFRLSEVLDAMRTSRSVSAVGS